jgi:aldose sugar dehydrogenase
MRLFRSFLLPLVILIGCTANGEGDGETATSAAAQDARPFAVEDLGRFEEPWAMVFLPAGNQALITERRGRLLLWGRQDQASAVTAVDGVPSVDYGGQGGLGDVVLHPDFANNRLVYLSWIEAGEGGRGAVVGRARLVAEGAPPRLEGMQVIWRQQPKLSGRGHYAHRLAFSPDGRHLFITSGDRQEFTPAQDLSGNLGKIVRLNADGSVPADNPFADRGGVAAQVWTLGHRNPLGIAFDLSGQLWAIEMGPAGGDELNLIERGRNYGYPIVSDGDHYDGRPIPDHDTRPEFAAPAVTWTPVISPGNMIVYSGSLFPHWRGDILAAALSGEAVVRVDLDGAGAREAERFAMGERIREIEQHPDGSIYLLQDMKDGKGGRLLRLTPAR